MMFASLSYLISELNIHCATVELAASVARMGLRRLGFAEIERCKVDAKSCDAKKIKNRNSVFIKGIIVDF